MRRGGSHVRCLGGPRHRAGNAGDPGADQRRAVDCYVGTLGEKRGDLPFEQRRRIEVAPPGAATTIALVAGDRPASASAPETATPRTPTWRAAASTRTRTSCT
jgi:hypothetical protein